MFTLLISIYYIKSSRLMFCYECPLLFSPKIFPILQSDDDCCNSCEDVREAYRKKGWAMSNPDLIDQVSLSISLTHTDIKVLQLLFLFFLGVKNAVEFCMRPLRCDNLALGISLSISTYFNLVGSLSYPSKEHNH